LPPYTLKKEKKKRKEEKKDKLNRQEYANADIVVSPAIQAGFLLKVILRMRPASPSGVRVVDPPPKGNTENNKPWRFANGRPQI